MTTNYFTIHDDGTTKTSELLQRCRDKFPVYSYWNGEELDKDFPPPKEPTTRYFRKNVEADEQFKKYVSANDLEKIGHQGITLRERVIMELQYFDETGEHLDKKSITLCTGSRDSNGLVPNAYWYSVEFKVNWSHRGDRYPFLRSRGCVNLEDKLSCSNEKNKDNQQINQINITCERCGLQMDFQIQVACRDKGDKES